MNYRSITARITGLFLISFSQVSLAVDEPFLSTPLEEVVVTAQKIEQDVLEVPNSLDVLDRKTIVDLNIRDINSFYQMIPGLNVSPVSDSNTGLRLFIRGIGSTDALIGQDSAVSVYKDGVYHSKGHALNLGFADIERIEILKGPQGTLYGRNTVGGSINIISRGASPDTLYGKATIGTGSFNQTFGQALLNIPFSDTAAMKLAFYKDDRSGWVDNLSPGSDFSNRDQQSARVDFIYDNGTSIILKYSAEYSDSDNSGYYYQPRPFEATEVLDVMLDEARVFSPNYSNDRTLQGSGQNRNNRAEALTHSLSLDYQFEENHTFKFLVGVDNLSSFTFVNYNNDINNAALSTALEGYSTDLNQAVSGYNKGGNDAIDGYNLAADGYRQLIDAINPTLEQSGIEPIPGIQTSILNKYVVNPLTAFPVFDAQANTAVFGLSPDSGQPFESNLYSTEFQFIGQTHDNFIKYVAGVFLLYEENYYTRNVSSNDYLEWLSAADPDWLLRSAEILPSLQIAGDMLMVAGEGLLAAEAAGRLAEAAANAFDLVEAGRQLGVIREHAAKAQTALDQAATAFPTVEEFSTLDQEDGNIIREGYSLAGNYASYSRSLAAYGNMTFSPNENWDLVVGLRYTIDNRQIETTHYTPLTSNISSAYSLSGGRDFDNLNAQFVARYHVATKSNYYFSYNSSYRAGGYNESFISLYVEDLEFDGERIDGYEFGYKGELLRGALRLETAIYYYQLRDLQYSIFDPATIVNRATVNTDGSVRGFDFDILLAVSRGLTFFLGYAYIDRRTENYLNIFSKLEEIPVSAQAPYHSTNFNINWSTPLGIDYSMGLRFSVDYRSGFNIVEGIRQGAHALTGLDINFVLHDFTIRLWAKNLTDEQYIIDGIPFDSTAAPGPDLVTYGLPRTVGLSAEYRF